MGSTGIGGNGFRAGWLASMSLNAPNGHFPTVSGMEDPSGAITPLWGLEEVCTFIGKSRNSVRVLLESEPDVPTPVIDGRQPRWLAEQWTTWAHQRASVKPRRRAT